MNLNEEDIGFIIGLTDPKRNYIEKSVWSKIFIHHHYQHLVDEEWIICDSKDLQFSYFVRPGIRWIFRCFIEERKKNGHI